MNCAYETTNFFIFSAFVVLILSSCANFQVAIMSSDKMNKLDLGMSKEQVTTILGNDYTIAEKRMELGKKVEVLSYRDYYKNDEFYLFVFKDNKLEKWYRELLPKEKVKSN